ncbi:serine/threonine-protein kinase [Polyangium sorediatum]|uniref:Protein kinase n=1 Tax=Polyangium sorediatum TaxID=889274 RepID=A0ABT6P311_9BACT|nr:serine/threonine-protein kinase [Polyangium sorediatum]MDI1434985.1 protein kinase [Polyangium sorediatum]
MQPRLIVGRYEIYEAIARGGMGAVHYGRLVGAEGFGRIVAVKRMHPHLLDDVALANAFLDEARLASRIQHPNVVPVIDVVRSEDELLIVMDYVRGESLAGPLRQHRIRGTLPPLRIVAGIVAQALHGLHAAHEARDASGKPLELVHRDISPQNVLVGVDGLARVVDFGIAKAAQRLQNTKEGELKGKPAYMAPEQFHGQASRATDVYAFGVVLWEALTGQRLYGGENDFQAIMQMLTTQASPPSSVRPEVPPALDALVMRAITKDAAARFPTAREMALDLERACPLASPAEIGEWVSSMAAEALAKRDVIVAYIESAQQSAPAEEPPSVRSPPLSARTPAPSQSDDVTTKKVGPPSGPTPLAAVVPRPPAAGESVYVEALPREVPPRVAPRDSRLAAIAGAVAFAVAATTGLVYVAFVRPAIMPEASPAASAPLVAPPPPSAAPPAVESAARPLTSASAVPATSAAAKRATAPSNTANPGRTPTTSKKSSSPSAAPDFL